MFGLPRKGYRNVSLREDVYSKLEALRVELGFSSLNDLILHLLTLKDLAGRIAGLRSYFLPVGTQ